MTEFRLFKSTLSPLGEQEFIGVANTATEDYAGDSVLPSGCELPPGRKNVPLFRDHDQSKIVGRAFPTITPGSVTIRATFAPPGASAIADETRALLKAGVLTDLSVGFEALDRKPRPGGGWTFTRWRLLEVSCVGVGCNPEATIVQRGFTLAKSCRVLSGANAAKLQEAHDLAEHCRSALADVLASAGTEPAKSFARRQREAEILRLAQSPISEDFKRRQRQIEIFALANPPV